MQIRIRGNWVHLLESTYHRLNPDTGAGGRSTLKLKHKFPANSLEIPLEVMKSLTDEEIERVMLVAIRPAREHERQRVENEKANRIAEAMHRIDPNWRIDAAIQPLEEAVSNVAEKGPDLDMSKLSEIFRHCIELCVTVSSTSEDPTKITAGLLTILSGAMARIATQIGGEVFPTAGDGNVKETEMYKAWMDTGSARQSLQIAMQKKQYVQTRSGDGAKVKK